MNASINKALSILNQLLIIFRHFSLSPRLGTHCIFHLKRSRFNPKSSRLFQSKRANQRFLISYHSKRKKRSKSFQIMSQLLNSKLSMRKKRVRQLNLKIRWLVIQSAIFVYSLTLLRDMRKKKDMSWYHLRPVIIFSIRNALDITCSKRKDKMKSPSLTVPIQIARR